MKDLYRFYNILADIHTRFYPTLRFGQMITVFESWLKKNKDIDDMFYIEEDKLLKYLLEMAESHNTKIKNVFDVMSYIFKI